jgi:hypothetical protein
LLSKTASKGFSIYGKRNQRFSLFHCSYFIKQLPNGFPVQDSIINALGMWLRFRKAKRRWPAARDYFTLSETLATSHVHG